MYGSLTLSRIKLTAPCSENIPPNFIMACTSDWCWLCSTLHPRPGIAADAKLAPYLSSTCPFFPDNLVVAGAIRGYGCPTYVAIVTWKLGSSMYPKWSGGDSRNYPLMLLHASHAHLLCAFRIREEAWIAPYSVPDHHHQSVTIHHSRPNLSHSESRMKMFEYRRLGFHNSPRQSVHMYVWTYVVSNRRSFVAVSLQFSALLPRFRCSLVCTYVCMNRMTDPGLPRFSAVLLRFCRGFATVIYDIM